MRHNRSNVLNVLFRDLMGLLFAVFMVLFVVVIIYMNPVGKKNEEEEVKSPGTLFVQLIWPDDMKSDLDLWVRGPNDVPVGFRNHDGKIMSLLRDDLGSVNDITSTNEEFAFSRGLPAGEYIVNVHYFKSKGGESDIPIEVVIGIKRNGGSISRLVRTGVMERQGVEKTIIRFTINKYGFIKPGSESDEYEPLFY